MSRSGSPDWVAPARHCCPTAKTCSSRRLQIDNELRALQCRFGKVRSRDYVDASGRVAAARAINQCLAFRHGISPKLLPVTDGAVSAHEADDESTTSPLSECTSIASPPRWAIRHVIDPDATFQFAARTRDVRGMER
jgi:hypothetical protein